jgi:hypothetical protein
MNRQKPQVSNRFIKGVRLTQKNESIINLIEFKQQIDYVIYLIYPDR